MAKRKSRSSKIIAGLKVEISDLKQALRVAQEQFDREAEYVAEVREAYSKENLKWFEAKTGLEVATQRLKETAEGLAILVSLLTGLKGTINESSAAYLICSGALEVAKELSL